MTSLDALRSALQSLRTNVLRSVLTSLGIIIGVGAVIAMVAIGAGAEYRVQSTIQQLGANVIIITNGSQSVGGAQSGGGTQLVLTEDDAEALGREIPAILVAAPQVRGTRQLIYGNTNWNSPVLGVTPDYLEARDWGIGEGRMLSDTEVRSAAKVAVLGTTVVKQLFGEGHDPMGQFIRINRVPFTVVGVLEEKGQTPFGQDQDDTVLIPLSTAKKRVLGGRQLKGNLVQTITLKARDDKSLDEAEREATALLRQRHKLRDGQPDDFRVRNIAQFMAARAESTRIMTMLLASVAAISLIVGGIGIMNIMLVSVTERTREIGLRMAVGARRGDIRNQFVVEAVTLSLLGGFIGTLFGVAGSYAIAAAAEWPVLLEAEAIALAVGFSAAVGVFFGFYPARKASRLDPIEALRYE
jgi:putative ABC transport system permease protein